jgi:hypothetical protein
MRLAPGAVVLQRKAGRRATRARQWTCLAQAQTLHVKVALPEALVVRVA